MSKKEKLIAKLRNRQSDNNWTMDECVMILALFGWSKTGGKGSHQVFSNPARDDVFVLASHGKSIKSGYIRELRELLFGES